MAANLLLVVIQFCSPKFDATRCMRDVSRCYDKKIAMTGDDLIQQELAVYNCIKTY